MLMIEKVPRQRLGETPMVPGRGRQVRCADTRFYPNKKGVPNKGCALPVAAKNKDPELRSKYSAGSEAQSCFPALKQKYHRA